MTEYTENEKKLLQMITALHGEINNLETRFNQSKDFCYRDISELQKRCNEIESPDSYYKITRR